MEWSRRDIALWNLTDKDNQEEKKMDGKTTLEQLRVTCRFSFINIKECGIQAVYGTHTIASITGIINAGEAEKAF